MRNNVREYISKVAKTRNIFYLPTKTAVELCCGSYGTIACPDFSVSSVYDVELIIYKWHMGRNEFVPHTSNLSPDGCANIRI